MILQTECSRIMQELETIESDLKEFEGIYVEDKSVWEGEAALEELCYISADRDDVLSSINEMRDMVSQISEG